MRYYIVIPAHNEEQFIAKTLDSVTNQTTLPAKVVVVNDHSTDKTESIIGRYASNFSFITKINTKAGTEHLPGSKVINAFNKGLETLDDDYEFLVKLDADLILPDDYFECIIQHFKENEDVGMVGGFAYELEENEWKLNHPMNNDHIRGAFKAYRKKCFEQIDGLRSAMGWDTVDEHLARFYQWKVVTDPTLKVKHLRPTGHSYNKKAKLLQGQAMYTMRLGFFLTLLTGLKFAFKNRNLRLFLDYIKGYYIASQNKVPFIVTKVQGRFIRNYRYKMLLSKIAG